MIFNNIPQTRVPGQYAEFAPLAPSGLSALRYVVLIIGQAISTGTKAAKELCLISSADVAASYFGRGSMIHRMAQKFYANNVSNEVYAIAATKDDVSSGTGKATGSIQVTHAATGNGTLALYIAGQRIAVTVTSGDTANDIASAIKAEIDANHLDLPVKSTAATDTVTFQALNVGATGNDIDIRVNYHDGEVLPDGVTVAIVAMSGGTSNPDISSGTPSLIDNLGDTWFQIIAMPYTDSANWTALETELDRRFGPITQIDGLAIAAVVDTYSNLVTFGSGKNTKQICAIGVNDVMQQPLEIAAAAAGQVAGALAIGSGAESRPFQTLPLVGINAPRSSYRFTFTELDSLLNNGIATLYTDEGGLVRIQRLITTYQTNDLGASDTAWLDANTRFTAMFIRYDWVNYLKTKYPRAKLAGSAERVGPGQVIMTPSVGRAEALARFGVWESVALVEDLDYFKSNLIAERDPVDVNAMNWFLPCDFVNQFRVGKTQIGVKL